MTMHDSREEQAINELLSEERMPAGLAQATMGRIQQARAAQTGSPDVPVPGESASQAAPVEQGWRVLDGEGSASRPGKASARLTRRHFVQLMAACLAVGCAGAATLAFAQETASVELGELARVRLGLNRWGTVVRVSCADVDMQRTVQDLGLFGLNYEEALARLMADESVLAELSGAEGLLVVVESPNQSQEQDVLGGCRRAAEGASCAAMCRSAGQGAGSGHGRGAGLGNGRGQGHGAGAGHGQGRGQVQGHGHGQENSSD